MSSPTHSPDRPPTQSGGAAFGLFAPPPASRLPPPASRLPGGDVSHQLGAPSGLYLPRMPAYSIGMSTTTPTAAHPTTHPTTRSVDSTPTEVFPPVQVHTLPSIQGLAPASAPTPDQAPAPAPAPTEDEDDFNILDAGRPRRLPAAHPSFVQLFVGAVIALITITGIAHLASRGMADAEAHCSHLAATDWAAAQSECGARHLSTEPASQAPPQPAQEPAQPSQEPYQADSASTPAPAPARTTSERPAWVTSDTAAPYDRTDPSASPLSLPRCTTSPDTPMPCLAHVSTDSRHAVVLEEDASLTALVRH